MKWYKALSLVNNSLEDEKKRRSREFKENIRTSVGLVTITCGVTIGNYCMETDEPTVLGGVIVGGSTALCTFIIVNHFRSLEVNRKIKRLKQVRKDLMQGINRFERTDEKDFSKALQMIYTDNKR
jgi:hypothetical protein